MHYFAGRGADRPESVAAKRPVPVQGHDSSVPKGKRVWRPFRLLDPNLPIESVPKQGLRNVRAPIDLTEEKHRADLRRADIQKDIIKLQEKYARETDEDKREKFLKKIAELEARL